MMQNISPEWAVQLGYEWQIPVELFIEYLKAPDPELIEVTFSGMRVAGSSERLRSTRGGVDLVTMRGVMDFVEDDRNSMTRDTSDVSIRIKTDDGRGMLRQHTNVSYSKVHSYLRKVSLLWELTLAS